MPMYDYATKKIYNLTLSNNGLEDKVQLKNREITIQEAVDYIEDYLNNGLPYEKNADFIYEVAEVRVLDIDGQDGLGGDRYYARIDRTGVRVGRIKGSKRQGSQKIQLRYERKAGFGTDIMEERIP